VSNLRRVKRICFWNLDVENVCGALVRSIGGTGNLTMQFRETVVLQLQLYMTLCHLHSNIDASLIALYPEPFISIKLNRNNLFYYSAEYE